jgi:hypothetical protein
MDDVQYRILVIKKTLSQREEKRIKGWDSTLKQATVALLLHRFEIIIHNNITIRRGITKCS